MTQPPSNDSPWPMTDNRPGPGSRPPRRLLKGTCSLIFEGQSFVPEGGTGKEYWLQLSGEMRERLVEILRPLGWRHEIEPFEAEFYGTLRWVSHGCGHLGVFGGIAEVQEIVAIHFTPAVKPIVSVPPRGIRGMIKVSCSSMGITKEQLDKVKGRATSGAESRH